MPIQAIECSLINFKKSASFTRELCEKFVCMIDSKLLKVKFYKSKKVSITIFEY